MGVVDVPWDSKVPYAWDRIEVGLLVYLLMGVVNVPWDSKVPWDRMDSGSTSIFVDGSVGFHGPMDGQ